MRDRYLLSVLLLISIAGFAQKPAEISIVSDNDMYTSPVNDQYYTNGIELIYRYLGNSRRESVAKKITEFRLGQYIYNPQSSRAPDIDVQDRPFAGYLFVKGGINTFYKNESALKLNLQLGVVGPESFARQLQEGLHKLIGYHTVEGWKYQITTIPAVQVQAFYSHKILAGTFNKKVDFYVQGEANAGTIWLGATVGAMARVSLKGLLFPMYESALYGSALNKDGNVYRGQKEFFLYFNPNLNYQAFDATIQGSPFNNKSPVTWPLIPFRFVGEAGIKYRHRNWTYSYAFIYKSKELTNIVVTSDYYGSISLTYHIGK